MSPQSPQTAAEIQAEEEYQKLLAKRMAQQQLQKRLAADLARPEQERKRAEEAYARSAPGRLAELRERRATAQVEAAIGRQVREMDLRYRYGQRFGGFLAGAERFGQSGMGRAVMGGVTAAGAFAGNAARSGFSGTVEGNRLAFEWQLLNREFASAFKPVIELFTAGVSRVRRFMQGLDGAGQRMVMIAGLLAGAYGTLRVARSVGGAIGLAGAASGLGGAGGLLGLGAGATALAGGGAAATAGKKSAPTVVPAGAGGGAGGGAVGRLAQAGLYAAPLFDAERGYSITGNALRGIRAKTDAERMGAAGDLLGDIKNNGGTFGGFGFDRLLLNSDYAKRKAAESGIDLDSPAAGKKNDPRQNVTPAEYGFDEVGSSYKRASISFLNNEAASTPGNTGESGQVPILQEIAKLMAQAVALAEKNGQPKGEVR